MAKSLLESVQQNFFSSGSPHKNSITGSGNSIGHKNVFLEEVKEYKGVFQNRQCVLCKGARKITLKQAVSAESAVCFEFQSRSESRNEH